MFIQFEDLKIAFFLCPILKTADEIERLGYQSQCSTSNRTCSPLQCCDNLRSITNNTLLTSTGKTHFHRRSSVGLPSIGSDHDDENEVAQANDTNTNPVSVLQVESPVAVTVNSET